MALQDKSVATTLEQGIEAAKPVAVPDYKLVKNGKEIQFSEDYLKKKKVPFFYKKNDLAISVVRNKYLHAEDNDNLANLWYRLAKALYDKQIENYKTSPYSLLHIYQVLEDWKYIFGGRINYSLGAKSVKSSLNNCYVVAIEHDSLYGIYQALAAAGLTYARGGGVGTDITILRPAGTKVSGTGSASPGATGFMDIISSNTGTISQHGRRGASLISIHCLHPDIEAFIDNKNDNFADYVAKIKKYDKRLGEDLNNDFSDRRRTSFSNVSVKFTDKFMAAVFENRKVQLFFPDIENCTDETDAKFIKVFDAKLMKYYMCYQNMTHAEAKEKIVGDKPFSIYDTRWDGDLDGWLEKGYPIKIYKTVNAGDVWDKFCASAWRSGEPGLFFLDRVTEAWTSTYQFVSTNPCGEIGLENGNSCCLGHQNFMHYIDVKNKRIDIDRLVADVPIIVFMQDLIHDVNEGRQALAVQEELSLKTRRLGIGITALADALISIGMKYDDDETIAYCEDIARALEIAKIKASIELAKTKGKFPSFDWKVMKASTFIQRLPEDLKKDLRDYGARNVAWSTIAPVGTGGILTQWSSSTEPIFAVYYKRRVKNDDGSYSTFYVYPKIITDLFGDHKNLPKHVVPAHKINYVKRIKMQAAFQRWVSNSISATINLPEQCTLQEVKDVYEAAFKHDLKGVTVYREGSRAGILITDGNDMKTELADGHAEKSPDRLAAQRIIRKAEGKKFYFTVSLNNGQPHEVFLNTNALSSATNSDTAVVTIEKLLRKHKVSQELIDSQLEKSKHQANSVRVCRLVSMALRHEIDLVKVVKALHDLEMPVSSFIYHLSKTLSEWIPDGTAYDNAGKWVYQNGCVINVETGESKC